MSVAHKSGHQGAAVTAFPDVCKTPSPGGPVPIPYPNAFGYGQQNTGSKTTSAGSKPTLTKSSNFSMSSGDEAGAARGVLSSKLRGQLQMLHIQIASLPSGDPTRWHKLLDQYVILTAELYKTLSE
jgi:hypothetical protein